METINGFTTVKVNLFLHILGVRPDGYHNIQTVFQLLNYGDELSCRLTKESITLKYKLATDITVDSDFNHHNLILRAAKLLKKYTHSPHGSQITLHKNVPLGSGLGGGSATAALTLCMLNQLWGCGLRSSELAILGSQLGSDVPLFIYQNNAFAEGVGEKLIPLTIPKRYYLVAIPPCMVSTKNIFSHWRLTKPPPISTIADIRKQLGGILDDPQTVGYQNDCQQIAEQHYPPLKKMYTILQRECPSVLFRLSGTGASYFAVFQQVEVARRQYEIVRFLSNQHRWQCFLASSFSAQ